MLRFVILIIFCLPTQLSFANASIDKAIMHYKPDGKLQASARRGKEKWIETRIVDGKERNCSKCSTKDLTKQGEHVKTGKTIDPLAVSVNPERFTKLKNGFVAITSGPLGESVPIRKK